MFSSGPAALSAQRDAADAHARAYIDALRDGDAAFGLTLFATTIAARDTTGVRTVLEAIVESLATVPRGVQPRLAGRHLRGGVGATLTDLTYVFADTAGSAAIELTVRNLDAGPEVAGVRWARVTKASPAPFRLSSGSAPGIAALLLAGMLALFSIGSAVAAVRSGMPHRWWWAFVALLGAGQVVVGWEAGVYETNLFTVQLFSAGLMRTATSPWVVKFAFPVGALIALQRRSRFLDSQRTRRAESEVRPAGAEEICAPAP